MNEDILQAKIYKWYHNNFCTKLNENPHIIFSVPNGGYRSKVEAMKMKATGLVAGVSDLIIVRPEAIYFVELKIDKGVQSKEQKNFQKNIENLGYTYLLFRTLESFKDYFNGKD